MNYITKGSNGKVDEDITGAKRDNQDDKERYDLLPLHALKRDAALYKRGAEKYGDRNWEKGQRVSRTLASLWRHLVAYQMGERTEDHLAAIRFNAASIIHVEEEVEAGRLPSELLDLDFYKTP